MAPNDPDDAGATTPPAETPPAGIPPAAVPPAAVPPAAPAGPGSPSAAAEPRSRRERSVQFMGTVKGRAVATKESIEGRRPTSPLIDAGFRLGEHNRAVGGVVLAGALAFRIFIFSVPFVFVFFVTLGLYGSADSPADAASAGGMSGLAANMVSDASTASQGARLTALIAGTFAMLWAAYGLARVMRITHALVWRCGLNRLSRPWIAPLVVIGYTLAATGLLRLLKFARDHLGTLGSGVTVGALLVFAALWLGVSMMLPRDERTNWFDLVPGALLVGLGVQVLHLATVYYFTAKVSSLSERYGALGAALGLLSWCYVVGWLFAGSAVLNAVVFDAFGRTRRRWFPAGIGPGEGDPVTSAGP